MWYENEHFNYTGNDRELQDVGYRNVNLND